jgi:murein DD-endopeptidase MepM/ murein hydrolase activator NlpD
MDTRRSCIAPQMAATEHQWRIHFRFTRVWSLYCGVIADLTHLSARPQGATMEDRKKLVVVLLVAIAAAAMAIWWLAQKPPRAAGEFSSADPAHAEACKRETEFPGHTAVMWVSIASLDNGNYRTTLEVTSDNGFDAFWQPALEPPVASPAGQRMFHLGRAPLKLELKESSTRGALIGKEQLSYAYLRDDQVRTASPAHPVTGRYPLSAASMVTQVNGDHVEEGSHFTAEGMGQAVDLQAPEGSGVVAFGAGTVVHVEDRFDDKLRCVRGHSSIHANKVAVLQDDGYEALYGHLQKGSTLVTEGMRVERGQPLGRLGEFNASATGSHLHFQLGGMTEAGLVSVPVAFEDEKGSSVVIPTVGKRILP